MIFVVGGRGLTGSAIVKHLEENDIEYANIQRDNKTEYQGKSCHVLIFANGNALKFKANQDPFFDFNASLTSLAEYVHKINYKQFVLISTVDVYDKKSELETTKEDSVINTSSLNTYGFHKLLCENYVRHYCQNYLIFRLPGLVGMGLKKNPVYDFINSEKKVMISPNSELNLINTRFMAESIFKILDLDIKNEIFNLASKNGLKISEISKVIGFDSQYTEDAKNHVQNYQINTEKISKYVDLSTSEQAIQEYYNSISLHNS